MLTEDLPEDKKLRQELHMKKLVRYYVVLQVGMVSSMYNGGKNFFTGSCSLTPLLLLYLWQYAGAYPGLFQGGFQNW